MRDLLNVAVAGATGYIGLELVRILSKHPKVRIIYPVSYTHLTLPTILLV